MIHEVYVDESDEETGWKEEPVQVLGEELTELTNYLEMLQDAMERPV